LIGHATIWQGLVATSLAGGTNGKDSV
jgi:hypothetical protein